MIYNLLDNIYTQKEFEKVVCINSNFVRKQELSVIDILKSKRDRFIVIDNAEEILGKEERQFIRKNSINPYLIMGRNRNYFGIRANSIGTLINDKKEMYIKYEEMEMPDEIKNRPLYFEIKLL